MLESLMERSNPAAMAPSPLWGGAPHLGTILCPFLGCNNCAVTHGVVSQVLLCKTRHWPWAQASP